MKNKLIYSALLCLLSVTLLSLTCPYDNTQPFPNNLPVHFTGRWVESTLGFYTSFYNHDFDIPVQIHTNIFAKDPSFPAAVEQAAVEWNNITNSYFNINILKNGSNYDYNFTNANIATGADLINLIGFDQGDEFADPNSDNSLKYLAYTHTYIPAEEYSNPQHTVYSCNYWYSPHITQADIVLNPNVSWALIASQSSATDNSFDFTTNACHEFGHLAGLKHVDSNPTAIMYSEIVKGKPEKFLSSVSGMDLLAIRLLYGGCDNNQTSYIPCSKFEVGDQFLIGAEDAGYDPCEGSQSTCCCECDGCREGIIKTGQISDRALTNIILYGTQNCHWRINVLQRNIIANADLFITISDTTNPVYHNVQLAMRNFISKNSPLIDATFRCELNVIQKDLTLKQENIAVSISLIDEILNLSITEGLREELIKLKSSLALYEGYNIKEAVLLYDSPSPN